MKKQTSISDWFDKKVNTLSQKKAKRFVDINLEFCDKVHKTIKENTIDYQILADALGWTLLDTKNNLTGMHNFNLKEIVAIEIALETEILNIK